MEKWSREQWDAAKQESDCVVYYLYTPICGTCAVASKMMEVISVMKPNIPMGKADLNYVQDIAVDYEIESVPCLLISRNGKISDKIYAFKSVPVLLEKVN
ncbi:thioredoxin family protein [Sporosarcina sp. CAU 1771]